MAVARGLRYLAVLVATLLAALQLVSLRLQRNQQEAENSALVLEVTHLRKLLREAQGRALEERPRASPSPAPFTASLGQPWVVRDSVNGTVSHSKVGDGARRASSGIGTGLGPGSIAVDIRIPVLGAAFRLSAQSNCRCAVSALGEDCPDVNRHNPKSLLSVSQPEPPPPSLPIQTPETCLTTDPV
eukprot:RCo055471